MSGCERRPGAGAAAATWGGTGVWLREWRHWRSRRRAWSRRYDWRRRRDWQSRRRARCSDRGAVLGGSLVALGQFNRPDVQLAALAHRGVPVGLGHGLAEGGKVAQVLKIRNAWERACAEEVCGRRDSGQRTHGRRPVTLGTSGECRIGVLRERRVPPTRTTKRSKGEENGVKKRKKEQRRKRSTKFFLAGGCSPRSWRLTFHALRSQEEGDESHCVRGRRFGASAGCFAPKHQHASPARRMSLKILQ